MYESMMKHIDTCEAAKKAFEEGSHFIDHKQVQLERRLTVNKNFTKTVKAMQISKGVVFPDKIFVFQKDSRTVSIMDTLSRTITHKSINFEGNFPHNFQMIQLGQTAQRVFIIGGGEYKSLPDSMF